MQRGLYILLFLAWATAMAAPPAPPYEVRSWRALSDRTLSPLARTVLRDGRHTWTHAESQNFIVHAARASLLPSVVQEAESTYTEIGRRLNWPIPPQRGRILVFDRPDDWQRVMTESGRREEGVALQVRNEIFILRGERHASSYVDLAHEMVHYRLWQEYERTTPLWLEEGLAVHLGWDVAKTFHLNERGLRLYREQPQMDSNERLPWPEFFALQAYPQTPRTAQAFYRQAGLLVAELARRFGDEELGRMTRLIVGSGWSMDDWLQRAQGWQPEEVQAMLHEIEQAWTVKQAE